METSEKNAAGPPGSFRRTMKPSMSLENPNDTCAVENENMEIAIATRNLLTFGVLLLTVKMNKQDQNSTKFIPENELKTL